MTQPAPPADPHEFSELMPHRITVSDYGTPNDYNEVAIDPATTRVYECLIDVRSYFMENQQAEMVYVICTAYINAVPIGSDTAVPIKDKSDIQFTPPPLGQPASRKLMGVEYHYWADGTLNNMVCRFL